MSKGKTQHRNIVIDQNLRGAIEHVLRELETVFKKGEYTPKDDMNNVMYQEGAQAPLNYIRRNMLGLEI